MATGSIICHTRSIKDTDITIGNSADKSSNIPAVSEPGCLRSEGGAESNENGTVTHLTDPWAVLVGLNESLV
jgi:hypothetical protein